MLVCGEAAACPRKIASKVINFGARVVSGLGRQEHVSPVLSELGWKSVDDLVRVSDLAVVHRLLTSDDAPEILRDKLVLDPLRRIGP